jgi:hypothetical protein
MPDASDPVDQHSGDPARLDDSTVYEHQSLVDLVNQVLDRGVVLHGDVTISVAGVDLVYLGLNALLSSVTTARRSYQAAVAAGSAAGVSAAVSHAALTPGAPRESSARAPRAPETGAPETGAAGPSASPEDRLAAEVVDVAQGLPARLDIDPDAVQRDLARLVLTIVELLRRVVEHQAVRRMEDDDLSEEQIERMGSALLQLEEKLHEIKKVFGVADHELNIDLGPLGKLL